MNFLGFFKSVSYAINMNNAAKVLSESFESVNQELASKTSKEDFSELKTVVLELGDSQKRIQQRKDQVKLIISLNS